MLLSLALLVCRSVLVEAYSSYYDPCPIYSCTLPRYDDAAICPSKYKDYRECLSGVFNPNNASQTGKVSNGICNCWGEFYAGSSIFLRLDVPVCEIQACYVKSQELLMCVHPVSLALSGYASTDEAIACIQNRSSQGNNANCFYDKIVDYDGNVAEDFIAVLEEIKAGCPVRKAFKCGFLLHPFYSPYVCEYADIDGAVRCVKDQLPDETCATTKKLLDTYVGIAIPVYQRVCSVTSESVNQFHANCGD